MKSHIVRIFIKKKKIQVLVSRTQLVLLIMVRIQIIRLCLDQQKPCIKKCKVLLRALSKKTQRSLANQLIPAQPLLLCRATEAFCIQLMEAHAHQVKNLALCSFANFTVFMASIKTEEQSITAVITFPSCKILF